MYMYIVVLHVLCYNKGNEVFVRCKMNTVTVKINGVEYNLKGKEDGKYLLDVARYVDGKFREISANNSKLGTSSVAVLAALNIADELFKCDLEVQDAIKKKNSLEERNLALKERLKELKEVIEESSKSRADEVESLKNIIYSMEDKVNEAGRLEETIVQLNERVAESDKYKENVDILQKELHYNKEQNEKLNKTIEALQKKLDSTVSMEEYKTLDLNLSKIQEENKALAAENENLKSSFEYASIKAKEAEIVEMEYRDIEEELRKAIMAKEVQIEELKKECEVENTNQIDNLREQLLLMEQDLRDCINEKEALKARNKEIRFELQNYKYKVLDLEKKLIDVQFNLAVEKKDKNPLVR